MKRMKNVYGVELPLLELQFATRGRVVCPDTYKLVPGAEALVEKLEGMIDQQRAKTPKYDSSWDRMGYRPSDKAGDELMKEILGDKRYIGYYHRYYYEEGDNIPHASDELDCWNEITLYLVLAIQSLNMETAIEHRHRAAVMLANVLLYGG